MNTLIDLEGLSRFLYNLREENKPFYVHAIVSAETTITTYDCKFSDIVKAWNSGRPIYVVDSERQYMITKGYDLDVSGLGGFNFQSGNDEYTLIDNNT